MSNNKSVTIQLTDKQRSALRGLTGEDHREVKFEAVTAATISVGKSLGITAGKKHLAAGKSMGITAGKKHLAAGKSMGITAGKKHLAAGKSMGISAGKAMSVTAGKATLTAGKSNLTAGKSI